MPLINLQTDLKSIKYGQDRPGGGDSGLPYIQTDINSLDNPNRTQVGRLITKLRFTKFDDGLVRGGIIGAINASVVDTLRIGKFLLDAPKGPLFIVKQVGLQLSNPKLETKNLRTDRSGIFGTIANLANRINNTVGPTRIYNLGVNTIAQIPVNAFGGHFNRHGILPVQTEDTKYLSVVQSNNQNGNNRLLGLTTKFKLGSQEGVEINTGVNRARNFLGRLATTFGINIRGLKPEQLVISEYKGGPGSVYGILGSTTINRTLEVTNDFKRIGDAAKWSTDYAGKTRDESGAATEIKIINTQDWGISTRSQSILSKTKYPELPKQISNINSSFILPIASDKDTTDRDQPVGYTVTPVYNNDLGKGSSSISQYPKVQDEPTAIDQTTIVAYSKSNPSLRKYADLATQINTINTSASLFLNNTIVQNKRDTNYPSFVESDLEKVLYPSSSLKNVYTSGSKNISIDRSPSGTLRYGQNNINALPSAFKYYSGRKTINEYNRSNDKNINADTLAVVFTPINPFTGNKVSKKFLAYLTDYSETYDSGWGETRYVGRAESFYIFNTFKRSINLGLNIPCFNSKELTENHNKLFALGKTGLAYALAGQYNGNNLLGGVITELTVGNYLKAAPGIINNLQFNIVDGSPWDLDRKYAQYIKCTFQFTVIGNEVPVYE